MTLPSPQQGPPAVRRAGRAGGLALGAVLGVTRAAGGQPATGETDAGARVAPPVLSGERQEPGRRNFMLNVKIGPSIGLKDLPTQLALQVELGVAITPDGLGSIILPLQLHIVHEPSAVMIPLGFQYDIPLPVKSLYLYPRASLGYAALFNDAGAISHMGVAVPEVGLKYTPGRFNFGLEPVSLPLLFDGTRVLVTYRVLAYAGVTF
jgi:hypothetical protein